MLTICSSKAVSSQSTAITTKQPAKNTGSNRSRDHFANSGPLTAATTPPAITNEIARLRTRSSAASAAANRKNRAKPIATPTSAMTTQKPATQQSVVEGKGVEVRVDRVGGRI